MALASSAASVARVDETQSSKLSVSSQPLPVEPLSAPPLETAEEAPPKVIAEEAPPKVIVEEAPPKVIVEEAPPKVIVEEAPPKVIVEEATPKVIVEEAPPKVIVEEVPPTPSTLPPTPSTLPLIEKKKKSIEDLLSDGVDILEIALYEESDFEEPKTPVMSELELKRQKKKELLAKAQEEKLAIKSVSIPPPPQPPSLPIVLEEKEDPMAIEIKSLKRKLDLSSQDCAQHCQKLQKMQQDLEAKDAQVASLKESLNLQQEQMMKIESDYQKRTGEFNAVNGKLAKTKGEFTEALKDLDRKRKELENTRHKNESYIATLNERDATIQELERQNKRINGEVTHYMSIIQKVPGETMNVLGDFQNVIARVRDMTVQSVLASFASLSDAGASGYEQVRQALPPTMQSQFPSLNFVGGEVTGEVNNLEQPFLQN